MVGQDLAGFSPVGYSAYRTSYSSHRPSNRAVGVSSLLRYVASHSSDIASGCFDGGPLFPKFSGTGGGITAYARAGGDGDLYNSGWSIYFQEREVIVKRLWVLSKPSFCL